MLVGKFLAERGSRRYGCWIAAWWPGSTKFRLLPNSSCNRVLDAVFRHMLKSRMIRAANTTLLRERGMKKFLLATSALAATASIASAQGGGG